MRGNSEDANQGAAVAGTDGREPRWTRHPRAETTERILDAAEDLFSRRDPDRVTVREIAAKAGVTHPVVHEYVGSKAEIVAAVVARGAPRRQQLMTEHPEFFEALPLVSSDVLNRRVHSRSVVRAAMDDRRYEALEDRVRSGEMLLALARKALDEGAQRPPAAAPIDPRFALAAATALVYGWVAMEDWLVQFYDLMDEDPADLRSQLVELLPQVAGLAFPLSAEAAAGAPSRNDTK